MHIESFEEFIKELDIEGGVVDLVVILKAIYLAYSRLCMRLEKLARWKDE